MKAVLTFDLPEESQQYAIANKGSDLSIILWDFDQWLRSELKWNDKLTEEQGNFYEAVRDKLRDIMSEHGLTFDDEIFT
jgi:hypothetical protein